jgi:hypothetical protein
MTDLKTAIREYLKHADALLLQEIRDGTITIDEAKQDTAEVEKWRTLLAVMDAETALHGGPE